jgi:hypothetical protein
MSKTKRDSSKLKQRPNCDPKMVASFDYERLDKVFGSLAKPAQRALINNQIFTPQDLAKRTEAEVVEFHGIGPSALPILRKYLKVKGLQFKK